MVKRVSGVLLFGLVILSAHGTASAQNHNVVYVEDRATCAVPANKCGTFGNHWHGIGNDTSGGIVPALADCATNAGGDDSVGCTVVLPRGYVDIGATIDLTPTHRREGLILRGHGSGERSTTSTYSFAGTTLVWTGSTPDPVLRVKSTSWSRFEDFSIDGGGTGNGNGIAGIGIEVTMTASTGPSQENIFRNLYIRNINGDTPLVEDGIGIKVAPDPITAQTSDMIFEDITIQYVRVGVFQDGGQTAGVHWERIQVTSYTKYGMEFVAGPINTDSCILIPDVGSTSEADVYVHNTADWASFQNNYHETKVGKSYEFQPGARYAPTLFLNTRVVWFPATGDVIDYAQHGPVTLIGNTFQLSDQTNSGLIHIHNQGGGGTAAVLSKGNNYAMGTTGSIVMSFYEDPPYESNITLESNDDPFKLGAPLESAVAHHFSHAGLVFEGGSLNWKAVGGNITHKQDSNGDFLRLLDGSNNVFAQWWNGGALHFPKPSSAIQFQSGTGITQIMGASSASGTQTVTLPARTGTALVSGDTLAGAVVGTLADGITTTALSSNVVLPSSLNASNSAGTAQVPSKSATNQFTWTDVVTPAGTQTLTSKTLTDPSNAFPGLGILSLQGTGPGTGTTYFAIAGPPGADAATQAPVPGLTAKRLLCRTTATGLSGTKRWEVYLRKNGADAGGACNLNASPSTCTVTENTTYNGTTDLLNLRVQAFGNPNGTIICSVSAGF